MRNSKLNFGSVSFDSIVLRRIRIRNILLKIEFKSFEVFIR